ncbi:MAG TPA: TIM barrel protein, partial [Bryobacteraceae bacterium]|nr:TIM barrel protein [Bryobacteraceae bacterium]
IMKDTGFPGIRLTSFPQLLTTFNITAEEMEREVSKRQLSVITISFNAPFQDPAQQDKVMTSARDAMKFLSRFGAKHLVCFTPNRTNMSEFSFKTLCDSLNNVGALANSMGFRAGLHNHLDQMVETPAEIDRCMKMTDPKKFWFSPDTAHLLLGGSDPVTMIRKYKDRLIFLDYKDAKWTEPTGEFVEDNGKTYPKEHRTAKFLNSIYDLGDGAVDFPSIHKVLKEIQYKGWLCVDLDAARKGPRASYERCGQYVVSKLEPIYK